MLRRLSMTIGGGWLTNDNGGASPFVWHKEWIATPEVAGQARNDDAMTGEVSISALFVIHCNTKNNSTPQNYQFNLIYILFF
jgi:hypothetical protein